MPLIFPENRLDYPGEIHFTSLQDSITNIEDAGNSSSAAERGAEQTGKSKSDIMSLLGFDDSFQTVKGKNGYVLSEKCILYLPQSLSFSDKASYNAANLGLIGGGVEAAIQSGMGVGESLASFVEQLRNNPGPVAKVAANEVLSAVGGDQIAAAVRSQSKVTSNPNTRALFESVPLRSFTFTFKMIPHTIQEAQNIKEIISYFRKELYPEEIPFGQSGVDFSIGYKFPNKFKIQTFYGKGAQRKEVGIKIMPSYLTDVQTTFNSGTMGMHYDGSFSEVDLSLSFMEAKALSRKDILEEGNENNTLTSEGGSREA